MFKAFLIKYAEIGLKGNNRYLFENALRDRIKDALEPCGDFMVSKEQGRIFIECPQEYDFEETVEALQRVFGISSICPVVVIEESHWDSLTQAVGDYVEKCIQIVSSHLKWKQNGRIKISFNFSRNLYRDGCIFTQEISRDESGCSGTPSSGYGRSS